MDTNDPGYLAAVEAVYAARKNSVRVSDKLPDMDHRQALDLQLGVLDRFVGDGDPAGAWKVSYTSGKARDRMGARFRPFGFISKSRVLSSGAHIKLASMANAAIEPELCLTLKRSLSGIVSYDEAFDAVESVRAAFEINENRYPEGGSNADTLAHGCGNWGIVIGDPVAPKFGLTATPVELFRDNESFTSKTPHESMDDPFLSLARLSAGLAPFNRTVEAGVHVITGSFARSEVLAPGEWRATFGGVGDVLVRFD